MQPKDISKQIEIMRDYFHEGHTLSYEARMHALQKLRTAILKHENEIYDALMQDLYKCETETYIVEIGMVLSELSYVEKHLKKWMKPHTVWTPLAQFHSHSYTVQDPYGVTLILSPWNYPFMLSMEPLIDAIAAGNCVCLKPSAYSPSTSSIMKTIIEECFDPSYICVIEGGRKENQALLSQNFDFIFFTGSQNVGKEVLRQAAENLTPVVLELGGKSPCIVDKSADLKLAARRIVFGKFLNCGQTCVAPDYFLVESSIKDAFIEEVKKEIVKQFDSDPLHNTEYGKIINEKHFMRVSGLIDKDKVVYGGHMNKDTCQIEPTIMDGVTEQDSVMQEEIFGPIMPILTFDYFDDMLHNLKHKDKPLALYIFSNTKENIKKVTTEISYGGGCINDVIIHLATSEMGFGGVGASGMGAYHGKIGFETFSHKKSIVDKKTWIDLPMRYRPYTNTLYKKMLRIFLR